MNKRKKTKYIHEGGFVAEVDVELIVTDDEWAPYLSLADAYKLDDVRDALRLGDLKRASNIARIFTMQPVAI
jgi:hypothetical protein